MTVQGRVFRHILFGRYACLSKDNVYIATMTNYNLLKEKEAKFFDKTGISILFTVKLKRTKRTHPYMLRNIGIEMNHFVPL